MENVVLTIFDIESEAYKSLLELRQQPVGDDYAVAEAALIKNVAGKIEFTDGFSVGTSPDDDTAYGTIIGSLVGVLGGPLGVLLGASTGALVGSMVDVADSEEIDLAIKVLAAKLCEGETAIVALVQEEEPAFDAAFAEYKTTIMRFDADDIAADIDRAYEAETEATRQAHRDIKAEHKAERAEIKEEQKAKWVARRAAQKEKVQASFDAVKAKGSQAFTDMKADVRTAADSIGSDLDKMSDAINSAFE